MSLLSIPLFPDRHQVHLITVEPCLPVHDPEIVVVVPDIYHKHVEMRTAWLLLEKDLRVALKQYLLPVF